MSTAAPITYSVDAEHVGWLLFDDPAGRANVFNAASLAALEQVIERLAAAPPRGVVVISGKERIFIAGADLQWLASLPDAAAAIDFARRGQQLFQRLNELPVPVVCAIHGACAGGGFELALACHWRIASTSPATRIGLPETGIGTIPGWGGCVRLPRLIGVKPALQHILKAQLLDPGAALDAGLIHELVPPEELRSRAQATALKLAIERPALRPPAAAAVPEFFGELRETTRARTRGRLPALLAAIDVVEQSSQLPTAAALEIEARLFGHVTAGATCRNLIHVFFLREAAKKRSLAGWFDGDAAASTPAAIRRVGVVGAGVMGSGIAQWLATRGIEVVLRDVQPAALGRGVTVIEELLAEAVARGKLPPADASTARARVTTTAGWDGFEGCDLVIEAIVEDVATKQRLFSELAERVPPETLLASNTSALPIEGIAGHVPHPERTLGIHFFNPVSRMPLVELVLARATSAATAAGGLALIRALGKVPVIVRSSPGFLVTRVLFFYLNEAVRLWEEGLPTTAIDAAMREFGWPMGPLRLIDEVGIDVTAFIFGELAQFFPDRFDRTQACSRLLAAGLRGRKGGTDRGFYRYDGWDAPNEPESRGIAGRRGEAALHPDEIVQQLMEVMVHEAELCLAEGVVKSAEDVDFALLTGAGFPAFRGGLLHWARAVRSGVIT